MAGTPLSPTVEDKAGKAGPLLTGQPWRIRDSALLLQSQRSLPADLISSQPPPLSDDYDLQTSLDRLRQDKADVVRMAFEAAACAILDGLDKADEDDDIESLDKEDLPQELQDIPTLERLRNYSMLRSHNNKDHAKRKAMDAAPITKAPKNPSSTPAGAPSPSPKQPDAPPKFTRNTPASSAAALDARLTSSRAILCTAANVVFEVLTPTLEGCPPIEVAKVPQNPNNPNPNSGSVSNMGAVVVEAQTLGQRIESVAISAARRSSRRYQYRRDNIQFGYKSSPRSVLTVSNPFAWKEEMEIDDEVEEHTYDPQTDAMTQMWTDTCLSRFLNILHTGVGHALYHDLDWTSRHGRISNLLQEMADQHSNFGPHLIITVEPDVDRFAREFRAVNSHLRLMSMVDPKALRALPYKGTPEQRKRLRNQFPDATGLPESSFHVIVVSYANFLQDYLHFCQFPFEVALVDDGAPWMAVAQADPNAPLGTVWESAMFSKNDHQMGLAGANQKEWDFGSDEFDEDSIKEAWVGLTARHRIMTTSTTCIQQRNSNDALPITGLLNFVMPHFADAVREEWDRSRIANDPASMEHFRNLLTRLTVVHAPKMDEASPYQLALESLEGKLPEVHVGDDSVPELIYDSEFVDNGKVSNSRRTALQWLGKVEGSWLRYELGLTNFQHIVDVMKASSMHGHLCEEILTASSTTSSGATGQITGTLAYRLAVRCGRHFGSEQGLRQHHSALHAPPGTWLCRTCGIDCVTSQARTHHERSCGQPTTVPGESENGGPVSAGDGGASKSKSHGPPGVVGKKKGTKTTSTLAEEKDPDGSIRVAGYRGVWVNQEGKNFVKIDSKRLEDENGDVLFFTSVDEAAKKHDDVLKAKGDKGKVEYNFKPDGTRVVYEDVSTSSTTGLGGGAASVVPALSVINIKDLPPDVKPLLRDPRQTSRTGGNSKRHVYAYRGVCRQARKGHDRWQSQISFMGVNHYLGTFDSEWDAAAIYAWAHLILYGEEATKQAQKEGEEAAAAFEKEKRDIAAGIVPAAAPKADKKPKRKPKKKEDEEKPKKKKKETPATEKKKVKPVADKESLAPVLSRSAGKAVVLAPRTALEDLSDIELATGVTKRVSAARLLNYATAGFSVPAPVSSFLRPCAPSRGQLVPPGGAMLFGLSSAMFGWDAAAFLQRRYFASETDAQRAETAIEELGPGGENEEFQTLIQGTLTILGCASYRTIRVYASLLGGATPPVGGAIGSIDCHLGGSSKTCGEAAASIRYLPTEDDENFSLSALSEDMVTLNGQRITSEMGSFPLSHEDVCTVGSRVFVILLPTP
eukprot:Nitzschia sp. Nitz4//scaffold119_size111653//105250//109419//NITZ4_004214-RA/size111653-augustus-gene-0.231-mRNA-1//-1//CDS//3329533908//2453//frame0